MAKPLTNMEETLNASSEAPAGSRRAIMLLRFLLLFLAAGALVVALLIARRGPAAPVERYACPMHANVRSQEPSACPICGMELERIGERFETGKNTSPDTTAYENARRHKVFGPVRMRSLPATVQEIRGPSWVTGESEIAAILYQDQIDALSSAETGRFSPTASPGTSLAVVRIPGPAVPWDRSTSVVRFRLSGARNALHPGEVGWVNVAARPRYVATLPISAVLQDPEGAYALVWTGGSGVEKRRFTIGESFEAQGFAVVLSGLRPNDFVVSRAAFFMDADRRLAGDDQARWSAP